MKKILYYFLPIFIISFLGCKNKPENENYDFRKVNWGMTKEQVIDNENEFNLKEKKDNILIYKGKLLGHDTELSYYFLNSNKLARTAYHLNFDSKLCIGMSNEERKNFIDRFIKNFTFYQKYLEQKYKPVKINEVSSKDRIAKESKWLTKNSKITHMLEINDPNSICSTFHSINYYSIQDEEKYKQDYVENYKKKIEKDSKNNL